MINIAVSLKVGGSLNYLEAFSVMYVSIKVSTKDPLTVFILHDHTLSPAHIELLSTITYQDDLFRFINVTENETFHHVSRFLQTSSAGCFTDAVLWRVFLPEFLPNVERLILCDVDLIFLFDIRKLWEVRLPENFCMAAVRRRRPYGQEYLRAINTSPEKYFRMGLSLIDMDALKNHRRFMEERVSFLHNDLPRINEIEPLNEQSLFNYFFSEQCLPLDVIRTGALENIDLAKDVVIDIKGWRFDMPLAFLYFFFLLKTPWRDEAIARFKHAKIGFALSNRSALLAKLFERVVKIAEP